MPQLWFCHICVLLLIFYIGLSVRKVVLALLLSWASLIWSSELQTLMSVENISCTTTVVGTLAGHFIYETYFGPIVTQVNPDRFKNRFRTMSSVTHKYKSPFNLNSIAQRHKTFRSFSTENKIIQQNCSCPELHFTANLQPSNRLNWIQINMIGLFY